MHTVAPELQSHRKPVRAVGEPLVWLTGAGLCAGILMVVWFLFLIASHGFSVFWPKEVHLIHLKPGSKTGINGALVIGGEIAKEQQRRTGVVRPNGEVEETRELQIFIGSRDVYGFSHKFIDASEIERMEEPKGIMEIERMEYGNAMGFPVLLAGPNGLQLAPQDPKFSSKFKEVIWEARRRRKEIQEIERNRIGDINAKLNNGRLREKAIRARTTADPVQLGAIESERAVLQSEYEKLAAEAQALRARQSDYTLTYRLVTGQEQRMAIGNVIRVSYPNDLTSFQKVRAFGRRIWSFLSEEPREANTEGGIFPAIFGTVIMTLLMSLAVTPFGIVAAIYLREYATQGPVVRAVRVAVNNLAGVPSIVFGVFGLGFFVYLIGGTIDQLFFSEALPSPTFGTGGILWAALTLALMTVPVVIVSTEEALAAVPRGMREGSLACGASKWQTIQRVVLPASSTGILTGLILAMARGAGEVAPLMLVGVVKLAPTLPFDTTWPFMHLDRKFMHLGFHIYDLGFQSPDSDAAIPMVFATTLFLILLVLLLNLSAILIRERLRRKFATGAF